MDLGHVILANTREVLTKEDASLTIVVSPENSGIKNERKPRESII